MCTAVLALTAPRLFRAVSQRAYDGIVDLLLGAIDFMLGTKAPWPGVERSSALAMLAMTLSSLAAKDGDASARAGFRPLTATEHSMGTLRRVVAVFIELLEQGADAEDLVIASTCTGHLMTHICEDTAGSGSGSAAGAGAYDPSAPGQFRETLAAVEGLVRLVAAMPRLLPTPMPSDDQARPPLHLIKQAQETSALLMRGLGWGQADPRLREELLAAAPGLVESTTKLVLRLSGPGSESADAEHDLNAAKLAFLEEVADHIGSKFKCLTILVLDNDLEDPAAASALSGYDSRQGCLASAWWLERMYSKDPALLS